jgi:hypothetical protein
MKTLFAILLLSLTGFAFGSEDSDPKEGTFLNLENDNTFNFDPPDEESEEGEPSPEIELGQDPGAMGEEDGGAQFGDEESEEGEEQPE